MDVHGSWPDALLYKEENWPRPGDGKRPLALWVLWEKHQGAGMLGAVALLGNTAASEGGRNFDWGGYEFWLACQEYCLKNCPWVNTFYLSYAKLEKLFKYYSKEAI